MYSQELVDLVASHHLDERNSFQDEFSFLEVGCGSGAISLSLLSENPQVSESVNQAICGSTAKHNHART